jgi:hypothetical protein
MNDARYCDFGIRNRIGILGHGFELQEVREVGVVDGMSMERYI